MLRGIHFLKYGDLAYKYSFSHQNQGPNFGVFSEKEISNSGFLFNSPKVRPLISTKNRKILEWCGP